MRYVLLLCCLLSSVFANELELSEVFPKKSFKRPVGLVQSAEKSDAWYVLEQHGKVWYCEAGAKKHVALDISSRLGTANEEGQLCAVLSPQYATDNKLYMYYSQKKPRKSIIASFEIKNEKILESSEQRLLEIAEPYGNHNGGQLAFGPDGFLYIGVGDGGKAGDPHKNGQNLKSLHGKILRIDPGQKTQGKAYGIPSDNPLLGKNLGRAEIYAWGLRNPWRFSFDRQTGDLICGDVGQNKQEEIDLIIKGGNYGWNKREGKKAFASKDNKAEWLEPFFTYDRKKGVSVTGGYVYNGKAIPDLMGWYLCSDFATGRYWLLKQKSGQLEKSIELKGDRLQVASFAEDKQGELYLMSYAKGTIYKLIGWKKN